MSAQEYYTSNVRELAKMIDDDIGIDYEIIDKREDGSGAILVYDIELSEHIQVRLFLDLNDLWGEM